MCDIVLCTELEWRLFCLLNTETDQVRGNLGSACAQHMTAFASSSKLTQQGLPDIQYSRETVNSHNLQLISFLMEGTQFRSK